MKKYNNILLNKDRIIKENIGKGGILMLVNNINQKRYVGRSVNLGNRFRNYLSKKYLLRQLKK